MVKINKNLKKKLSQISLFVEVQYSLKLDISKVAEDLAEGSKSFSELLYDKALRLRQ